MTTTFDNKADILVQFGWAYFDEPNFADFVEENAHTIDICADYLKNKMTLNRKQKQSIENLFQYIVSITGHEDVGFTDLEDFFVPNYDGEGHIIMGWERSPLLGG